MYFTRITDISKLEEYISRYQLPFEIFKPKIVVKLEDIPELLKQEFKDKVTIRFGKELDYRVVKLLDIFSDFLCIYKCGKPFIVKVKWDEAKLFLKKVYEIYGNEENYRNVDIIIWEGYVPKEDQLGAAEIMLDFENDKVYLEIIWEFGKTPKDITTYGRYNIGIEVKNGIVYKYNGVYIPSRFLYDLIRVAKYMGEVINEDHKLMVFDISLHRSFRKYLWEIIYV